MFSPTPASGPVKRWKTPSICVSRLSPSDRVSRLAPSSRQYDGTTSVIANAHASTTACGHNRASDDRQRTLASSRSQSSSRPGSAHACSFTASAQRNARPEKARQARTATRSPARRRAPASFARRCASAASRLNAAISAVDRPDTYVTASVCAGCSANTSAVKNAAGASTTSRGASRRTSAKTSSAFVACSAMLSTWKPATPSPLVQFAV